MQPYHVIKKGTHGTLAEVGAQSPNVGASPGLYYLIAVPRML